MKEMYLVPDMTMELLEDVVSTTVTSIPLSEDELPVFCEDED